jgi:hypothetical protein
MWMRLLIVSALLIPSVAAAEGSPLSVYALWNFRSNRNNLPLSVLSAPSGAQATLHPQAFNTSLAGLGVRWRTSEKWFIDGSFALLTSAKLTASGIYETSASAGPQMFREISSMQVVRLLSQRDFRFNSALAAQFGLGLALYRVSTRGDSGVAGGFNGSDPVKVSLTPSLRAGLEATFGSLGVGLGVLFDPALKKTSGPSSANFADLSGLSLEPVFVYHF